LEARLADPILEYYAYREQNLHEAQLSSILDQSFVLHLHLKPYGPHLDLINRYDLKVVFLWRNLGDVILSLDDHLMKEDCCTSAAYVDNAADYHKMLAEARHRFLIQYGLNWYLSFYLLWQKVEDPGWLVRAKYEDMVRDKFAFFERILQSLGAKFEPQRLREILGAPIPASRFNKGVVGRSIEGLSERNKLLLERMLMEYPQDLSELLAELPWRPTKRASDLG
jgi:hypothetical protein